MLSALQQGLASDFGKMTEKLAAEASGTAPDAGSIETGLQDGLYAIGCRTRGPSWNRPAPLRLARPCGSASSASGVSTGPCGSD